MSNASVLMSPIWVSMGGVGWLLRQFDRVPYAVLALPLRLAVADDPNAAAWLAAHLAAGHFSDFALSDAENPSFAAEHAQ